MKARHAFLALALTLVPLAVSGAIATSARAATAPDGRVYEMVTPPDKGGATVGVNFATDAFGPEAWVSSSGSRVYVAGGNQTYGAPPQFVAASETFQIDRTATGWQATNITPLPLGAGAPPTSGTGFSFGAATPDLSTTAWFTGLIISPEQLGSGSNLYLRTPSGSWEYVSNGSLNTSTQTGLMAYFSTLFSADGSHLVFTAARQLEPPADGQLTGLPGGGTVYDWAGGVNHVVNVCSADTAASGTPLEDGRCTATSPSDPSAPALVSPKGATLGDAGNGLSTAAGDFNAVSSDGSRIFFTSPDPGATATTNSPAPPATGCATSGTGTTCTPRLYVRENGSVTKEVSVSQVPGQQMSAQAQIYYQNASTDGSKVFFTTSQPMTTDDPNGGEDPTTVADPSSVDLYEDDVDTGTLTRISAGPTGDADPDVQQPGGGVIGVSDDGSVVYFTTVNPIPGVTGPRCGPTPGTSTCGVAGGTTQRNIYVYDGNRSGAARWQFVATVPFATTGYPSCIAGSHVVGAATTQTGTANTGNRCVQVTPDGHYMVFETTASLVPADADSQLDVYRYDEQTDQLTDVSLGVDGAGNGAFPADMGEVASGGISPINITDDGSQVFFETAEPLVPGDTNTTVDTYEWDDGTVSLVSPGDTQDNAFYAGAGTDGRDVFFTTTQSIDPADYDGLNDVYDARVGGGFPAAPGPVPCSGEQCQGTPTPAPSPLDAATSAFTGPADVISTPPAVTATASAAVKLLTRSARGSAFTLRVRASARGKLTISGDGIATKRRSLSKAGTYQLRVTLKRAAKLKLAREHKLTMVVHAKLQPTSGRVASAAARINVTTPRHK